MLSPAAAGAGAGPQRLLQPLPPQPPRPALSGRAWAESLPAHGALVAARWVRGFRAPPLPSGSEAGAPEVASRGAPAGQTSLPDAAVQWAGTPDPSGLEALWGPQNFPERCESKRRAGQGSGEGVVLPASARWESRRPKLVR